MPDDTDTSPEDDDEIEDMLAGRRALPAGLELLPPVPHDEHEPADPPPDEGAPPAATE